MTAALDLQGIWKSFSGIEVLRGVDLSVRRGEIRALLGANGAGKSTLMKIAAGVYRPDKGTVAVNGETVCLRSPLDGFHAGIAVVHQETSLVPSASALQNVFMGREPMRRGLLDERAMREEYRRLADLVGVDVAPETAARNLGAAEKKLVEIMKAVARDSSILIMDEPTDSLGRPEVAMLFSVIRDLKARGITVIYITHFLSEVADLADEATVLRDGEVVATRPAGELRIDELVRLILGRQGPSPAAVARTRAETTRASASSPLLELHGLSRPGEFEEVSLSLARGEVLGIVGVVGSGKTELARAIAGATRPARGSLSMAGRAIKTREPYQAISRGIGMAPEDRKAHGLFLDHPVTWNVGISSLARRSKLGLIDERAERKASAGALASLSARYASPAQKARYLSGGNQQKLVVARWLLASPDVLVLDEPTRGVDVGAKAELYEALRRLAREGRGIVFFTGEPEEALAVADRVLVMQRGRLMTPRGDRPGEDELLRCMLEVNDDR